MLVRIANTLTLGKPLVMYLGLLTLLVWLVAIATIVLGRNRQSGRRTIWHRRIVAVALTLALIHMVLGLSLFF
jgi:hypothetical protein